MRAADDCAPHAARVSRSAFGFGFGDGVPGFFFSVFFSRLGGPVGAGGFMGAV